MLIFTAAMFLMISNTVSKVQGYEVDYGNNIADSILESAQQTEDISTLELPEYSDVLQGVAVISDGNLQKSNSETPDIFMDTL